MTQKTLSSAAIEQYRQYLLLLARQEIDPCMQAKLDVSGVVQETFLQAHQNWAQFNGKSQGELAAWLRRILAHNLADALRGVRRAKRDIGRERSIEASLEHSSAHLVGLLEANQESPSQEAQLEEGALRLADALERLPESQREALVLQHWHGWSLAQIAQHMNKTPVAVAGLLKRGLKELRVLLAEEKTR